MIYFLKQSLVEAGVELIRKPKLDLNFWSACLDPLPECWGYRSHSSFVPCWALNQDISIQAGQAF